MSPAASGSDGLFQVGVSHLLAGVSTRERLALTQEAVAGVLRQLQGGHEDEERVLLSTCGRLEVYGWSPRPQEAIARARAWFTAQAGPEIESVLMSRQGSHALRHLFRVTAGLESWILGESEVLGQVRRAYEGARALEVTGSALNRVFQSGVAAGKAVRAATGLQNGIRSIGGAAAMLARSIFGQRDDGVMIVFGAGEMAESAALHLAAKSFKRIYIANRTLERAKALADKVQGTPLELSEGLAMLERADAGLFSLTTETPLLDVAKVRASVTARRRPLFLVDLGMPRNVHPECASVDGVYLYNLDDLKGVVAQSIAGKQSQKEAAESLIDLAAARCALELDKAAARRGAAHTEAA